MAHFESAEWAGLAAAPRLRDMRSGTYSRYQPDLLCERPLRLAPETRERAWIVEKRVRGLEDLPGARGLEALSRFLLRSEAIASSQIEGLVVSPQRVGLAELVQQKDLPPGGRDETAAQVAALMLALRRATHELADSARITEDGVVDLQRILMSEDSELVGIRSQQNWIGGSDYHPLDAEFVPPEPGAVGALIADLVGYMNTGDHAPLVQAALVHAQFETIHPFRDGNGRVGRSLIHTVLVRRRLTRTAVLPVSAILLTRSDEYVSGLTEYRYSGAVGSEACDLAVSSWIDTFLMAVDQSVSLAEEFALELDELRAEWHRALADSRVERGIRDAPRAGSATALILAGLQETPVLTASLVAEQFDVSPLSARKALEELADSGILARRSLSGRAKCYLAKSVFDMLSLSERRLASTRWDTRETSPNRAAPAQPRSKI